MNYISPETSSSIKRLCQVLWNNTAALEEKITFSYHGQQFQCNYINLGPYLEDVQCLFPSLIEKKIFIRKEYTMAYQHLIKKSSSRKGEVIMGHPGIGKTTFLLYLLIDSLRRGRPIVLQNSASFYMIFNDDGVTFHSGADWKGLNGFEKIWVLTDANEDLSSPSRFLLLLDNVFIVHASSPERQYWAWSTRFRSFRCYVMDTLPDKEIICIAYLLDVDICHAVIKSKKWGPITRTIIFMLRSSRPDNYEHNLSETVHSTALSLAFNPMQLDMDNMDNHSGNFCGCNLFTIRPGPDTRRAYRLNIATPHIAKIIGDAFVKAASHGRYFQAKFFVMMESEQYSCIEASWIFQALVHTYFTSAAPPENRLRISTKFNTTNRLYSQLKHASSLESFYWRPSSPGFPGIISIFYEKDSKTLYAIQTGDTSDEDIAKGLKIVKKRLPKSFRTDTQWVLLFTAPDQDQASRHQQSISLPKTMKVDVQCCVVSLADTVLSMVELERVFLLRNN